MNGCPEPVETGASRWDLGCFDMDLERFTRLGYLRLERVDGHRAYFVTVDGERALSENRKLVEVLP